MPTASSDTINVLVFECAAKTFAIPTEKVREILPFPLLSCPPGLPSFLEGFLNLEGQVIPVLNLPELFSLPDSSQRFYSHLLILVMNNSPLALRAERALETIEISNADLLPIPQGLVFSECIAGDFLLNESVVHLLSVDKLLLKMEQDRVEQLRLMEEARLEQLSESSL